MKFKWPVCVCPYNHSRQAAWIAFLLQLNKELFVAEATNFSILIRGPLSPVIGCPQVKSVASLSASIASSCAIERSGTRGLRWDELDLTQPQWGRGPHQLKHTSPVAYLRLHPKRINNFSVVKKRERERERRGRREKNASHPEGRTKQAYRRCSALKKIPNKASHPFSFLNGAAIPSVWRAGGYEWKSFHWGKSKLWT